MGMIVPVKKRYDVAKMNYERDYPPIPTESVDGWKTVEVVDNGEKLEPVGPFSSFTDCDVEGNYFGERGRLGSEMNFVGRPIDRRVSLITHFVREGVLEKIKLAQSVLPDGFYFKFFDNYRSLEVQQALFDAVKNGIKLNHSDWPEEKLMEETQKFCSLPSPNKLLGSVHPSPHNTGGVVDLTIIKLTSEGKRCLRVLNDDYRKGRLNYSVSENEIGLMEEINREVKGWENKYKWGARVTEVVMNNWLANYRYFIQKAHIFHNYSQELNMGTGFDYFGLETKTDYFECQARELSITEKTVRHNRRFLYSVLNGVGFKNYPEEWWHWSYGDQMWGRNTDEKIAIYGGIELTDENRQFEEMRREVYFDQIGRIGENSLFSRDRQSDPRIK